MPDGSDSVETQNKFGHIDIPKTKRQANMPGIASVSGVVGSAAALASSVFGGIDNSHADKLVNGAPTHDINPEKGRNIQSEESEGVKIVPLLSETAQELYKNISIEEVGKLNSQISKMEKVIRENPSYEDMVRVVEESDPYILEAAQKYNIPINVLRGMVLIENGGGHALESPVGALGPAQLMPDTARELGLRVDSKVDERLNPEKSFLAMAEYLDNMKDIFGGNLGIAVWAYHAGPGNVAEAIRIYFIDTEHLDLGDFNQDTYEEAIAVKQNYSNKIIESKLNVHELLSNEAVLQQVISRLEDETEYYPAKAAAGGNMFSKKVSEVSTNSTASE